MGRLQDAAAAEGGAAVTPKLAEAAAAAGAPPPDAGTGEPPTGAPQPGTGEPPPVAPQPGTGEPPPVAGARPSSGAGGAIQPYLQQADGREQEEYKRAIRAMAKVLYGNDDTANAIVDQIRPDNLVSDTSKVTMLFIKELDRKVNMDEAVIAEVTRESVERIAELAEARHQVQYQPSDMEKILGATWEGVQSMFGNEDIQGYVQTVQGMAPQDLEAIKQQQDAVLSQAKG